MFGSGWCIGKLEIRERQAQHVNNEKPSGQFLGLIVMSY
jgi:hypothetical protein